MWASDKGNSLAKQAQAGGTSAIAHAVRQHEIPNEGNVEVLHQSEHVEPNACTTAYHTCQFAFDCARQLRSRMTLQFRLPHSLQAADTWGGHTRIYFRHIQCLCSKGNKGAHGDNAMGMESKNIVLLWVQLCCIYKGYGAVLCAFLPYPQSDAGHERCSHFKLLLFQVVIGAARAVIAEDRSTAQCSVLQWHHLHKEVSLPSQKGRC